VDVHDLVARDVAEDDLPRHLGHAHELVGAPYVQRDLVAVKLAQLGPELSHRIDGLVVGLGGGRVRHVLVIVERQDVDGVEERSRDRWDRLDGWEGRWGDWGWRRAKDLDYDWHRGTRGLRGRIDHQRVRTADYSNRWRWWWRRRWLWRVVVIVAVSPHGGGRAGPRRPVLPVSGWAAARAGAAAPRGARENQVGEGAAVEVIVVAGFVGEAAGARATQAGAAAPAARATPRRLEHAYGWD